MTHDADTNSIVCKMSGQLHKSDLPQYCSGLAALLKEYNCTQVLQDFTEVDLKLPIMDLYEVPEFIRKTRSEEGLTHCTKRAIVFARDAEDWQFYENVAVNRGELVKTFTDIHEAKHWLTG